LVFCRSKILGGEEGVIAPSAPAYVYAWLGQEMRDSVEKLTNTPF